MISRRAALGLGGAFVAAAGLAACGGASATGGGSAAATVSGLASSAAESAGGSIRILDDNTNTIFTDSVIADFQKATGVKVAKYEQANFNDLHDRLATLFSAKDSSYDVVMTWAAWTAEFGRAGWLQPLNKQALPAGILPATLDAVSYGNVVYGLPKFVSAQTMFWNKRMFEKAGLDAQGPQNWNEFVSAAKELTGAGQYGYACDLGNVDGAYQNFLRMLLLNGGTMYTDTTTPAFDSDAGIDALSRLVGLLHTQKVMNPSSLQITNSSDLSTLFAAGRTGIVFNWPSQYTAARDGAIGAEDVGNGLIPGITVRSASIDGSEGFAINQYSKNKPAALRWLQYVTTTPVQTLMVTKESWLPVTTSLLQSPAIVRDLPVVTTYQQEAKYEIKRFGAPWYSDVVQALSTNITKAMLRSQSPKQALQDAAAKAKTIIAQYK